MTGITVDYMEIKNRDINLKISNPVLGIYKGMFRVKLPGKEYMAVRLQIAK